MAWIGIVFVLIALAMLMGPIMLMQPSRMERRQASYRQKAASCGVRVRQDSSELSTGAWPVIIYELPHKEEPSDVFVSWELVRQPYSHGIHFHGHWDWVGESANSTLDQSALKNLLNLLPADTERVGVSQVSAFCCWRESGRNGGLEAVLEALPKLHDLTSLG